MDMDLFQRERCSNCRTVYNLNASPQSTQPIVETIRCREHSR